jgi:carbon-monoxide dehydrogenase small subunit
MEFTGTQLIPARRAAVWAALNDPAALQQCIQGCERFEAMGPGQWLAVVMAAVGPVKARFTGTVSLHDIEPLAGYRLEGQGQGGVAGFGKLEARVRLSDEDGATRLDYTAQAQVGGKLAQIGSRLVSGAAAKMAEQFFSAFNALLSGGGLMAFAPVQAQADAGTERDDGQLALVQLQVNGRPVERRVEARALLVEFLRKDLGLTGTHVGCDTTQCGACTVNLDGVAVKSCTVLAAQASGGQVVTIEGLAPADGLHPLQQAFNQCHALQCGFCTPGMIMAADGLLRSGCAVDDAAIEHALEGNLCRCTGYVHIIDAVKHAARQMGRATGEGIAS